MDTEQMIEVEEQEAPEAPFQITMSLDKDFVREFKRLSRKYGEQIQRINGFTQDQLNFTGFIDNFVDTTTVADATIDGNANSGTKDIVTMQSDMKKPHTKLLSFNKIFYEMRKKYGLDRAKKWLEDEWSGALYMHDAHNCSMIPYCVKGTELLRIRRNDEEKLITLQDLWVMLETGAHLMPDGQTYSKKVSDIQVFDGEQWTDISCMTRTPAQIKTLRYIKLANGMALSVTNDHTMITSQGEKKAKDIQPGDVIYTEKSVLNYPTNPHIYCAAELKQAGVLDNLSYARLGGFFIDSSTDLEQEASFSFARDCSYFPNKLELDADLGYLLGIWLAEGYSQGNRLRIVQNRGPQLQRIISICERNHLSYACHPRSGESMQLYIGSPQLYQVFTALFTKGHKAQEKRLSPFVFSRTNREFILGIVGGLIDGDGYITPNNQHGVEFFSTSRALVNQVAYVLRAEGYIVREKLHHASAPREYQGRKIESKSNGYCIYFACSADVEDFSSDKIRECRSAEVGYSYDPAQAESKYTFGYGDQEVLGNVEEPFQKDDYVYDITTGTHKFLCNGIQTHNCYAYDLDEVAARGLFFINRFKTKAPQHLDTFNNHVLEFVSWTSNRQSGAVGLPSYLIYSFYFWKKDVDSGYCADPIRYRDQQFQKFIYDLNQPYLRITECAFTNVSIFDREYLMGLFGGRQYPDGSFVIDYVEDLIEYQKAFMEIVSKIRSETMMTFPVLTYSLLFQSGKFVDEDFARWCNRHNMKWCDSNFFVGNDVTTLSNCCRLLSDTTKVKASGFINSIGGTSLKIGSVKVSTINLRRVALEAAGDKNKFFRILKGRTALDIEVLDIVRHVIKRNIEKGLLPQYTYRLMNLDTQYNTIGVTALYECVNEFGGIAEDEFGNKYYTDEGLQFATDVLDCIKEVKNSYNLDYSINIEAIPAESANIKLCYKDELLYPDNPNKYFIYSNQWIPLMEKCTLSEKIRLGSVLDNACEGGVIAHINLAGDFADEEQAWQLLNYIASKGVIYFAYNKEISVCEDEHGFFGDTCPQCGKPKVDSYCRVVGFLTPRSSYSKERKHEFDSRKWFTLQNDWM